MNIRIEVLTHPVMDQRVNEVNPKHPAQQSSLIAHLHSLSMLHDTDLFIEFGAGRAEFSRYVNQALLPPFTDVPLLRQHFLFVDRSPVRNKCDKRLRDEFAAAGVQDLNDRVKRIKGDIKDLHLSAALAANFSNMEQIDFCAISKHLCGAATDLTLSCLSQLSLETEKYRCKGVVIALCCHSRCTYRSLHQEAKAWFAARGIGLTEFEIIRQLSTWRTNGLREGLDPDFVGTHFSGLSHRERETIGWNCKRTIDMARIHTMEYMGYSARLIEYVNPSITTECVALIATRNR